MSKAFVKEDDEDDDSLDDQDPQALAGVLEQRCHTHPTPEPLIAFPSLEPDGAKQLQALVDQALEPATPNAP
ncbi:MAG: hypothetical protein ACO3C3_14005 [Burkholderiaceae bacterium]